MEILLIIAIITITSVVVYGAKRFLQKSKLFEELHENDWNIRVDAVKELEEQFLLAGTNHPEIIGQLVQALHTDPDWQVRCAAITALTHHLEPPLLDRLLTLIEQDDDWHVRAQVIRAITPTENFMILGHVFPLLLPDVEWQIRCAAISALGQSFYRDRSHIRDSNLASRFVTTVLPFLEDEHPRVRAEVAATLGDTERSCAISPLITVLHDSDKQVRQQAANSLVRLCSIVETVVFGRPAEMFQYATVAYNPDVSQIPVLMPALEHVSIHVASCHIPRVEEFTNYLMTRYEPSYRQTHISIAIEGDPIQFSPRAYEIWNTCQSVEISITTVIFGQKTLTDYQQQETLYNPDVSHLTLPLGRLERIIIQTATYSFHHVERFVTYAVNSIGQKHLKKHVTVSLDGDPEHLHPNLYNSLQNICKEIQWKNEQKKNHKRAIKDM